MTSHTRMHVIKRSGNSEPIYFDKITTRNEKLCTDLDIDPTLLSQKVINSLKDGMTTSEIDVLSAETALYMSTHEPDYEILAKRIIISNLHKNTTESFTEVCEMLYNMGLLNSDYYTFVMDNTTKLNNIPNYNRDYDFSYFGYKTLEKSYLNKTDKGKIMERPQHLWLRVAVFLRMPDVDAIKQVYDMLSSRQFIHGSPTLFNAGSNRSQLSSCFVKDTPVLTVKGVKKIQDVEYGDLVFTHKDNIRHVVQLHKNPLNGRKVMELKTTCGNIIHVTDNHRFWTISNKNNHPPKWRAIKDLSQEYSIMKKQGLSNMVTEFTQIEYIKPTTLTPEYVYTLGVEEDHSYTVGNGLVCENCFLLSMNDQLEDMLDCMKYAGLISKYAGGIGINISMVRSKGSRIASTGGKSDGIIPFMKVWNSLACYVNQSSRRKGAVAIYLEPHHPDIFDFLQVRKNNTKEALQCLDIHIALWVPDLFMKRVREDGMWSLFDPNVVKGLHDIYGEEYERVYTDAENKKLYTTQVPAKELWNEIIIAQMETGEPYMLYKDHVNRKSNQKNIGVIRGSNLCAEITLYTDNDTISVCNLASISLPAFVKRHEDNKSSREWYIYYRNDCKWCDKTVEFLGNNNENLRLIDGVKHKDDIVKFSTKYNHHTYPFIFHVNQETGCREFVGGYSELVEYYNCKYVYGLLYFDYKALGKAAELLTENMNIVIDKNFYPVEQARRTNMETRPIGIGTQGLADVLQLLDYSWDDDATTILNKNIYAVIYYHSVKKSMELAKTHGTYKYYEGSPASQGILQYDMWDVEPVTVDGLLDWTWLKSEIAKHGLRNSTLTTSMPTASTSQILGNNESFEPYTSNMYSRECLSGTFPVINRHLCKRMKEMNLWTNENVDQIIRNNGSIQTISGLNDRFRQIYKTSWELKMRRMIDLSADRGAYTCMTQSLNQFMENVTPSKLSSMHMYGWQRGLKTGMYYLRMRTGVSAVKFSLMDKQEECTGCSA